MINGAERIEKGADLKVSPEALPHLGVLAEKKELTIWCTIFGYFIDISNSVYLKQIRFFPVSSMVNGITLSSIIIRDLGMVLFWFSSTLLVAKTFLILNVITICLFPSISLPVLVPGLMTSQFYFCSSILSNFSIWVSPPSDLIFIVARVIFF